MKSAGKDEIQAEMLKALNGGVRLMTKVCQVVWKLEKTQKDWQKIGRCLAP